MQQKTKKCILLCVAVNGGDRNQRLYRTLCSPIRWQMRFGCCCCFVYFFGFCLRCRFIFSAPPNEENRSFLVCFDLIMFYLLRFRHSRGRFVETRLQEVQEEVEERARCGGDGEAPEELLWVELDGFCIDSWGARQTLGAALEEPKGGARKHRDFVSLVFRVGWRDQKKTKKAQEKENR